MKRIVCARYKEAICVKKRWANCLSILCDFWFQIWRFCTFWFSNKDVYNFSSFVILAFNLLFLYLPSCLRRWWKVLNSDFLLVWMIIFLFFEVVEHIILSDYPIFFSSPLDTYLYFRAYFAIDFLAYSGMGSVSFWLYLPGL